MGGVQIEAITTEKQGVVAIGDSETAFDCGAIDYVGCSSWTRYAEGLMNVPWYNRAIGGTTCAQMDTAYATTATPMAVRAKYLFLMCGTNDIGGSGYTVSAVETSISDIASKAATDGFIFVIGTVGPFLTAASNPAIESKRLALNAWISQTYPFVLDFDKIIRDPYDPRFISRDPLWYPTADGTHPLQAGRRAAGSYVACSYVGNSLGCPQIWSFQQPMPYQPVPAGVATQNRALNVGAITTAGAFSNAIDAADTFSTAAGLFGLVNSGASSDFGIQLKGTGTGGRDWRVEEGRSAAGELDISDCSASCSQRVRFQSTGAIVFPGPTVSAIHTLAAGTAPNLTTGTGTIAGFDEAGRVTLTAGSQTTITVTFGQTYVTNIPICGAWDNGVPATNVATLTTLVITGTFGATDKLTWICKGF
jgi:lysophospholipase L1-like esterase